jgi:DNA-binding response OmpR family regulator
MLVEDDLFMQQVINQYLKGKFNIITFDNGMDAWIYLQKGAEPVMIIADLNIPQVTGLELLKQIKASSFFNTIPILILSGEESTDVKIDCLEAGADDYMVKPFNPRELEVRIRKVIDRMTTPTNG